MNRNCIISEIKKFENEIVEWRRFLHENAEVRFDLDTTKKFVYNKLKELGYTPEYCGKAGVVATVGNGDKTFMIRADMDALNLCEEASVEFAAKNGNMHACGHDMHTAMLLGAAKYLKQNEDKLSGKVKLMFQAAEETLEGAADMISSGVLDSPVPDAALMIHVTTGTSLETGFTIVCDSGVSSPAVNYFTINIQGKGCHGSMPHMGIDAITVGANILTALQEIKARELSINDEAVMTVGTFNGGKSANVIADTATLTGTMRAFDDSVMEQLKKRTTEISESIANAYRATATVTFDSGCPTLYNNKEISDSAFKYCCELLGNERVLLSRERSGGSEDFSYISHKIPSVMLAISAGKTEDGYTYPLHNPKVTFDESVLCIGSAVYAWNAIRWLSEN